MTVPPRATLTPPLASPPVEVANTPYWPAAVPAWRLPPVVTDTTSVASVPVVVARMASRVPVTVPVPVCTVTAPPVPVPPEVDVALMASKAPPAFSVTAPAPVLTTTSPFPVASMTSPLVAWMVDPAWVRPLASTVAVPVVSAITWMPSPPVPVMAVVWPTESRAVTVAVLSELST